MGQPRFGEATLTDCDREPIHLAASIQPHGCLVAVDPATQRIVQCAGDFLRIMGVDDPLGLTLSELVGDAAAAHLIEQSGQVRSRPQPIKGIEIEVETRDGAIDAILHVSGPLLVIEFEKPDGSLSRLREPLAAVHRMIAALHDASGMDAFLQACTTQMREATGFDRVMVYGFLPDGSGKVLAEAKHDDVESFLGLHYPESDIPKQARELYRHSRIRLIPDVGYTPQKLRPPFHPETGEPLDLSFSIFRSVSPLHVQYLRNMGVGASMSISLLHRGQLWGLIACHHRTPLFLSCDLRAACELFAQMFSLQLEARLRADDYEHALQMREVHQRILARLGEFTDLSRGLLHHRPGLLDLVRADGVAVLVEGTISQAGHTPTPAAIQTLVRVLSERSEPGLFVSDRLAEDLPDAGIGPADAAGVLAVSTSRSPRDWIVWFRREVVETVTWAGNPAKAIRLTAEGETLTPRSSFQAWREIVKGRSVRWRELEVEAAQSLRTAITDTVLQRLDQATRERNDAHARQTVLVAELDHRVKNLLGQIQALMRRTRHPEHTLDTYVESLDRRIRSMAYAQTLLSESRWRGAELGRLLDEELRQFEADPGSVRIAGDRVELTPRAALTLGLVLHELASNACRHGALSTPDGTLDIRWKVESEVLRLDWREQGGPPVSPPRRRGFGRTLIETSIAYELRGEVKLDFAASGVQASLLVPLEHILGASASGGTQSATVAPYQPAAKPRILVVEDSMLAALDLTATLEQLGYAVSGPTGRVDAALALVERDAPDLAVLDINLGDADSFPIADRLTARGTPFLFLTGYDPRMIVPERFSACAVVSKPFAADKLRAALIELRPG